MRAFDLLEPIHQLDVIPPYDVNWYGLRQPVFWRMAAAQRQKRRLLVEQWFLLLLRTLLIVLVVLATMWRLGNRSLANNYADPLQYMNTDRPADLLYYYMETIPFGIGYGLMLALVPAELRDEPGPLRGPDRRRAPPRRSSRGHSHR